MAHGFKAVYGIHNARSNEFADPAAPGDNQGYAAFGHVVEGMEVIQKIFDAPTSPTARTRS